MSILRRSIVLGINLALIGAAASLLGARSLDAQEKAFMCSDTKCFAGYCEQNSDSDCFYVDPYTCYTTGC
jgi:hypothetical protein